MKIAGLSVNTEEIREKDDFYATYPSAITAALPILQSMGLSNNVWECACGEGHIAKVLTENGYNVYSSDLINRGYGDIQDFLKCDKIYDGDILTNPPFKLAIEFVEKAHELLMDGNHLFLFLKIQFLESRKRKELFEKYPPKYVAVYSERQKCAKNGEFEKYSQNANTQCFAWFVWEKGYTGDTIIKWI